MERVRARRRASKKHKSVETIISIISPDDMADFLRLEMNSDPDMRGRFVDYFALRRAAKKATEEKGEDEAAKKARIIRNEKTYRQHYDNVTALYEAVVKKYGSLDARKRVKFDRFEKDARARIKSGDRTGAAAVYRAVAEATADIMPKADPDDTFYYNAFARALHRLASCYGSKKAGFGLKKEGISMIFEMLRKKSANVGTDPYIDELVEFCNGNRQKLEYLRDLASRALPAKAPPKEDGAAHRVAVGVAALLADVLTSLDDPSTEDVLEAYHMENDHTCAAYVRALAKRDRKAAQRLLDGAVGPYSYTILAEAALEVYDEGSPAHLRLLENMYVGSASAEYYERLRSTHPNWDEYRDAALDNLARYSYHKYLLIQALLIEGMWERAAEAISDADDIRLLIDFHDDLVRAAGPADAYAACRDIIEGYLAYALERKKYALACEAIKKMAGIPGHAEDTRRFIAGIRHKHSGRRALLEEIRKVE
ncbi:MAG: hypothetical protein J4F28_00165 [Nitrosopumilaceae archaeon]|nr:hypothetical protein [Nitrosopumilaceae archaeon]